MRRLAIRFFLRTSLRGKAEAADSRDGGSPRVALEIHPLDQCGAALRGSVRSASRSGRAAESRGGERIRTGVGTPPRPLEGNRGGGALSLLARAPQFDRP